VHDTARCAIPINTDTKNYDIICTIDISEEKMEKGEKIEISKQSLVNCENGQILEIKDNALTEEETGDEIKVVDNSLKVKEEGTAAVVIQDTKPIETPQKVEVPKDTTDYKNQAFNNTFDGNTTINRDIKIEDPKPKDLNKTEIWDMSEVIKEVNSNEKN
jgi:hypothetical protein